MKFTGERFIPDSSVDGELEHIHRYLLAQTLVAGKRVLDIACGEGYGSKLLSQRAEKVWGVDIAVETVEHARLTYGASNLEFLRGDCAAIPFENASFDVVVSFETIEHHDQHEKMISEIRRVLKSDGVLIISSPDKRHYSDERGYVNEYHVKELYRDEFLRLLKGSFSNVEVYSQRLLYGSAIFSETVAKPARSYAKADGSFVGTEGVRAPLYLVAVAGAGALPALPHGVYETPIENSDAFREMLRSADERDGKLAGMTAAFKDRDAGLAKAQVEIERLSDLLSEVSSTLESVVLDRDSQREGVALLSERMATVQAEHEDRVLLLANTLAAAEDRTRQLVGTLEERDGHIRRLNIELAESTTQIGQLEMARTALLIECETARAAMKDLQERFSQLEKERAGDMLETETKLRERDALNENLARVISDLYRSRSWRVTAPLRAATRLVDKIKRRSARVLNVPPTTTALSVASPSIDTPVKTAPFRILLVSYYCPTRAHAGGLRILDMYALIRQKCPNVQIDLLTHHRPEVDWSIEELPKIFSNVYLSPVEDLTPVGLAALRGSVVPYDVIDLQFHQTGHHIDAFRAIGGKILFTPMEAQTKVLFLDLRAKFNRSVGSRLLKFAAGIRTAAVEIGFTQKADDVVCVSRADAAFLRAVTSSHHIRWVDTGVSSFEFADALAPDFLPTSAAERPCRVLYVAYFGSETNVNALRWYLEHVHPQVKARVPGYVLTVVGRGDMTPFAAYRDEGIEFVGEVPVIAPHIAQARVCIAPALSGSGFRGKVNQYAVLGCPSVVSPIAAKGLAYRDGVDIFIAESPQTFAERCAELLTDSALNDKMGQAARALCLQRYSWESKWPAIRRLYKLENQT